MIKKIILSVLFPILSGLFFPFSLLLSDTIIVDINGGGDYATIQEGINAVTDDDTVLVYPGTYYENINYNGKNVTVASLYLITQDNSYIDSTIIDGNQNGSVVIFKNGEDSTAVLCGFTVQNGSGTVYQYIFICGGGIYCKDVSPTITDCIIKNNTAQWGGGIQCISSNINLKNVSVYNNRAIYIGGGICFRNNSTVYFDENCRCSIYLNYAGAGSDIFLFDCNEITEIVVDTFTVLNPDQDFVNTFFSCNLNFDILNAKIELVNGDLYVSPAGDDANSGIIPEDPLKTISYALLKVASDSTHPNNIHLEADTYSPSLTGERFPLNPRSFVGIIGQSEQNTFLDGDNLYYLVNCSCNDKDIRLERLTIQNGRERVGAGITFSYNSNGIVKNVTIKDNYATELFGGGIYCGDNCNPIFENVIITNNQAETGAGVRISQSSSPVFINCVISDNSSFSPFSGSGGMTCVIDCHPVFINTIFSKNQGISYPGGCITESNVEFINTNFVGHYNEEETIVLAFGSNSEFINSIMWDSTDDEIYFATDGEPNYAEISYTDIRGGESGINTNNNGSYYWGPGNINQNPMFVDTLNDNYQLQPGSPCIDAGTPDTTGLNLPPTDLAGYPRIYNGRIDIGAYEYQGNGVVDPEDEFYKKLYLFQNKPNPFSSSTTITFISADYERLKDYKLSIYNAKGQLIKTYNGKRDNFWVKTDIVWDGKDEDGKKVSPGVYFYKLIYGDNSVTKKMILVR